MKRQKDKYKFGKSKLVPFRSGEDSSERHMRRKATAHGWESAVRSFCRELGLSLAICNGGHHWLFVRMGQHSMFIVEWWPSSAKLVIQRKYGEGIHVHDAVQAMRVIKVALEDWRETHDPKPLLVSALLEKPKDDRWLMRWIRKVRESISA